MKFVFSEAIHYIDEICTVVKYANVSAVSLSLNGNIEENVVANLTKLKNAGIETIVNTNYDYYLSSDSKREKFADYRKYVEGFLAKYDSLIDNVYISDIYKFIGEEIFDMVSAKTIFPVNLDINESDMDRIANAGIRKVHLYWTTSKAFSWHPKAKNFVLELKKRNLEVCLWNYSKKDLNRLKNIDYVNVKLWRSGTKFGRMLILKNKVLEEAVIADSPMALSTMLSHPIWKEFNSDTVKNQIAQKNYRYVDVWNLLTYCNWLDANTEKPPAYMETVEIANRTDTPLPDWINGKDKRGESKLKYLNSRFNNLKTGKNAKIVSKNALMCDNCVVQKTCPIFEAGSVCGFLPYWNRMRIKDRNADTVMKNMEEVLSNKLARYERAKFMEMANGGDLDVRVSQMENDLIKSFEIYNKVLTGGNRGGNLNVLQIGDNKMVVADIKTELENLQKTYGQEVIKKIRQKVGVTENGNTDGNSDNS